MANIKELSKKEERFTGGHRACTGCGGSIIMRQTMIAVADKNVVVGSATGCMEVVSTLFPYTAWKVPFIHSAFENSAATISGVEAAYQSLKKQGKINKDIKFIAIGGDGGTYDIGFQSLSGAMERGHDMVYICYDNQAYMNCLSLDSLIATKEGIKKITDINVGDEVYAFDMKTHQLVLKKCSGVYDNGIHDVYELSTLHHSIKATSNHPFLVLKRNGTGKGREFVWKELKDVLPEDEIVVSKQLTPGKSMQFNFQGSKKGDYKVNKINEVSIPKSSSKELMKYLGLFVGDGWRRLKRPEVGFALPENSPGREALIGLHKNIFGNSISMDKTYIYVHSINVANFIDSLNFGKGAKNKKVPEWIFTLPREEKEAFVEGLMLSDGYQIGNSMRYVSASTMLLKSLRLLLQTVDYRVGKVHTQTKVAGTTCVKRKLLKDSHYGYICFSKYRPWNVEKYHSQYKDKNYLIDNKYFSLEKVQKIQFIAEEPTLDLQVEDEHNFIANGMVVHNTGVQRSSATPKGASTTTAPAGKVKQGKEQFRKDLTAAMVAHDIPYVAQSAVGFWNDYINKVKKAVETKGPAFINVLAPCRLGWPHDPSKTPDLGRIAVNTCFWPIYEVVNGKYKINQKPKQKLPITEWLKIQGRFKHLFRPENKQLLDELQQEVDSRWEHLLKLEQAFGN